MKPTALGLLLLVAAAAAGCGASSSAQSQRFLTRADGVCGHFSALQNQVQFPSVHPLAATTTHAARAEWAVALKQVAYLGKQEVNALRALRPPDPLRDRFAQLVDVKDAAFDDLLAGAAAARRNEVAQIEAPVSAGRKKLARASTLAKQLGVASCS